MITGTEVTKVSGVVVITVTFVTGPHTFTPICNPHVPNTHTHICHMHAHANTHASATARTCVHARTATCTAPEHART